MAEYGTRLARASQYAVELHQRQRRKGSDVPYVAHLFGVASLVAEFGGSETQGIAALLHDAIEDHPRKGETEREIAELFGNEVLRLVRGCTNTFKVGPKYDGEDDSFIAGKKLYLKHLAGLDVDTLLVVFCDKLHNARSTVYNLNESGNSVWERFKGGKDKTLWYFTALVAIGVLAPNAEYLPRQLITQLVSTVGNAITLAGDDKEQLLSDANLQNIYRQCIIARAS
jgi:(p)ppGpp synthase/HD superfamily hydrolase